MYVQNTSLHFIKKVPYGTLPKSESIIYNRNRILTAGYKLMYLWAVISVTGYMILVTRHLHLNMPMLQ